MKIFHFIAIGDNKYRGKDEYIVLSDDDMVEPREGFRLNRTYECDCDSGSLPLDRELVAG